MSIFLQCIFIDETWQLRIKSCVNKHILARASMQIRPCYARIEFHRRFRNFYLHFVCFLSVLEINSNYSRPKECCFFELSCVFLLHAWVVYYNEYMGTQRIVSVNYLFGKPDMGNLRPSSFRIDKNVVWGTEKRSAKIFGKEIRPKVFGKWTKMP